MDDVVRFRVLIVSTLDEVDKIKEMYPGMLYGMQKSDVILNTELHKIQGRRIQRAYISSTVDMKSDVVEYVFRALQYEPGDKQPIILYPSWRRDDEVDWKELFKKFININGAQLGMSTEEVVALPPCLMTLEEWRHIVELTEELFKEGSDD